MADSTLPPPNAIPSTAMPPNTGAPTTGTPLAAPVASSPMPIGTMSFEQALAELEQIVARLEQGKIALEDAINAYERGAALKQHCEAKLREAKERVDKISVGPDGAVSTVPFAAA